MFLEGIGKWKVVIAVKYIKKTPDTFLSRPSKHDEAGTCHEEKKNCLVQFAFQSFQCWSLLASGKDLVGWKGSHENLSPTFCPSRLGSEFRPDSSGHCLAGPQSRGSITSLGSCSSSPRGDMPTSNQSLFSFNPLPVLGAPHCSVSQQPFPWALIGSFVAHQSHCVTRLSWPYFLSLSSQGKSSSPHCHAALLWVCASLSTFFLHCGAQSKVVLDHI